MPEGLRLGEPVRSTGRALPRRVVATAFDSSRCNPACNPRNFIQNSATRLRPKTRQIYSNILKNDRMKKSGWKRRPWQAGRSTICMCLGEHRGRIQRPPEPVLKRPAVVSERRRRGGRGFLRLRDRGSPKEFPRSSRRRPTYPGHPSHEYAFRERRGARPIAPG